MRRATYEGLTKYVVETFKRPLLNEAFLLAPGLLAQSATMDNHLRRVAASMSMSVTYDTSPIVPELGSGVKAVNDFVARLTRAALPSSHFVEFFPWMRYIPSRCSWLPRLPPAMTSEQPQAAEGSGQSQREGLVPLTRDGSVVSPNTSASTSSQEGSWLVLERYLAITSWTGQHNTISGEIGTSGAGTGKGNFDFMTLPGWSSTDSGVQMVTRKSRTQGKERRATQQSKISRRSTNVLKFSSSYSPV